ncbi:hypothetical protein F5141DRAFT_196927 [Pisolithus sp. B1]|nr:hypothetical protein F5141DRAFT_196927 [Pisolithus sp. B1]
MFRLSMAYDCFFFNSPFSKVSIGLCALCTLVLVTVLAAVFFLSMYSVLRFLLLVWSNGRSAGSKEWAMETRQHLLIDEGSGRRGKTQRAQCRDSASHIRLQAVLMIDSMYTGGQGKLVMMFFLYSCFWSTHAAFLRHRETSASGFSASSSNVN